MMHVYLENLKNPTVRFEVVSYDKATHTAKIKGEYGAEFSRDVSKEALAKYGYRIVKSEKPLSLKSISVQPAPAKAAPPPEDEDEEAPPPPPKKKAKKPVVAEDEEE
jgi:hypothetical protein